MIVAETETVHPDSYVHVLRTEEFFLEGQGSHYLLGQKRALEAIFPSIDCIESYNDFERSP